MKLNHTSFLIRRRARPAASAGFAAHLRRLPFALVFAAAMAGCSVDAPKHAAEPGALASKPQQTYAVVHLQNGFTEVYLARNGAGKWMMIDTGIPDMSKVGILNSGGDALIAEMAKKGIRPADVALVVVTHGHGDHAGNANYLQQKYGMKIVAGVADNDKFHRGKTDLTKTDQSIWGTAGKTLAAISDIDYPAFKPDVLVGADAVDLKAFGFHGEIHPAPGHTPGSVVVAIDQHLFSGDLIGVNVDVTGHSLETLKIVPNGKGATEFFFVENREQAKAQLSIVDRLMSKYQVTTVYPTHFGPLKAEQVQRYVEENRVKTTM